MKYKFLTILLAVFLLNTPVFSQTDSKNETETESLGLPGDNLDLYAVLDLFQKSKTIEEFEKSLNDEKVGINNLDLNLDGKVDFIKVETEQNKNDFLFVLQDDVNEKETQDVAVILVSKDDKGKVSLQIVGDEDLYGKDYVIEPKTETPSVTPNPAYSGADTVVVTSQPSTVVVVESEPIVKYIYSPVFVPYHSPFYFGFYPPFFRPYPVISFNIYFGHTSHYHNRYHGGYYNRGGNTIVVNNNTYNNYSRNRKTSNTVNRNKTNGNYRNINSSNKSKNNRPANRPSNKSKAKPADRKANTSKTRPATKHSNTSKVKPANRPTNTSKTRPATKQHSTMHNTTRPKSKPASKPTNRPIRRGR